MKILLPLITAWLLVSCGPPMPETGPSPYGYYSVSDVNYFWEVGLCFELSACPLPRAQRWTSPIFIQTHGQYSQQESAELDNIIAELSQLTGLSITKTTSNANINIYFIPQNQFVDGNRCPGYESSNPQEGYFAISNEDSVITQAWICIDSNVDSTKKLHLLREELTQSLGIGSDSNSYLDSIFQQDPSYQPTQYAEIDKKVIRLLYDNRVQPGMTQVEIDQALRTPPTTQTAFVGGTSFEGG